MKGFADCHLHITDPGFGEGYPGIENTSLLFSCTAKPSEWMLLLNIASENEKIIPFFGTHPWYCDSYDKNGLIDILSKNKKACVGEIGLDTCHNNMKKQKEIFEEQLDIADEFDRPAAIHSVRTDNEMLRMLKKHRGGRIILHSYSSPQYAKQFAELGCYFSISPRSINRSEEKNRELIQSVPEERLLLETDYPCFDFVLDDFVTKVSSLASVDTDALIEMTSENARRLIQ